MRDDASRCGFDLYLEEEWRGGVCALCLDPTPPQPAAWKRDPCGVERLVGRGASEGLGNPPLPGCGSVGFENQKEFGRHLDSEGSGAVIADQDAPARFPHTNGSGSNQYGEFVVSRAAVCDRSLAVCRAGARPGQ